MENPDDKLVNQDDFKEEWTGFCSSCKSVFESICSVGQPSDLSKFLENLSDEDINTRGLEEHAITIKMTKTGAADHSEKNLQAITASLSGKQKTNNTKYKSHEPRPQERNHEKCVDFAKVVHNDILATTKRNSEHLTSSNQSLNAETLQEIVKKHMSMEIKSFIDSSIFLSSAEPSIQSYREFNSNNTSNILKSRNRILQTTNRLMNLRWALRKVENSVRKVYFSISFSTSLDNMREVILKQIEKEPTSNNQRSIIKRPLDCETSTRTTNLGKRHINRISTEKHLMYNYNPFSSANKRKEEFSCTNSVI